MLHKMVQNVLNLPIYCNSLIRKINGFTLSFYKSFALLCFLHIYISIVEIYIYFLFFTLITKI